MRLLGWYGKDLKSYGTQKSCFNVEYRSLSTWRRWPSEERSSRQKTTDAQRNPVISDRSPFGYQERGQDSAMIDRSFNCQD
ncbi:hypothetical protein CDAR_14301 [Caerostris darwini]|uniref:Ycf15 n=1 Tax=Caerostris darwini TaxID=1538125 RepID=A0AAV4QDH8_9ARAC|nr:hypothetical protein CDAR_14301 [Caerostris darwini]